MQHVCRVTITGELKSYTPAIKDLIPVLNIANNSGCGQASRVFTRSPPDDRNTKFGDSTCRTINGDPIHALFDTKGIYKREKARFQ